MPVIRKVVALCALMVGLVGAASAAERLAMGLIVKLKSAQPTSVVQLRATLKPQELPSTTRLRLSAATQRRGVSFLVQRPTAFGAQVIHSRYPTTLAAAEAQARALRQDPDVEWVVVNEIAWPHAIASNDPHYTLGLQTWMEDAATGALPNVPAAFSRLASLGRALDPVVVAVLDTGVVRHPDFAGRVLFDEGYDFISEVDFANDGNGQDADATDPGDYLTAETIRSNRVLYEGCSAQNSSWHGTSTAGVLAQAMNNGIGGIGMLALLPNTPVLPVRVSGACGAAVNDIIEGMLWAAGIEYNGSPSTNPHPARVLSLSFGGEGGCACVNKSNLSGTDGGSCLYQNVIDALTSKGAVLVASAGNGDNSVGGSLATRPASCPGALAVTALNVNGAKAQYANLVSSSGIATMGGDPAFGDSGIYTTSNFGSTGPSPSAGSPGDDYVTEAGTSFSAPIAAGAIALMWSANPGLTVQQVLDGLRTHGVRAHVNTGQSTCSASNTGSCTCTTAACGAGVLDVDKAVAWAASQPYGSYVAPRVVASFFTPDLSAPAKSSGGGGGAINVVELLALALLALWAVAQRVSQLTKPLPAGTGKLLKRACHSA
jgi:serine protease